MKHKISLFITFCILSFIIGCEQPTRTKYPVPVTLKYENNVECPIIDRGDRLDCPAPDSTGIKCNTITNVTDENRTTKIIINESDIDKNGTKEFIETGTIKETIGANSTISIPYYRKCNVGDVSNSGVHRIAEIHELRNVSKKEKSIVKSFKCSSRCLSDFPSEDCFTQKHKLSPEIKIKYQNSLVKLSKELNQERKIDSLGLLSILGADSNVCLLGEIQYSNGTYKTEQTNCGFKTKFIGNTEIIGKWDDKTIFTVPKNKPNHVEIAFVTGPDIWFRDASGNEDITLNKLVSGRANSIEFLAESIHINLPTMCLSAVLE